MSALQIQDDSQLRRLQEDGVVELARLFVKERERLKKTINFDLGTGLAARVDASDIVQDTFVAASRSLSKYLTTPQIPPYLWLRRLAKKVVQATRRHHYGRAMRDVAREQQVADNSDQLLADFLAVSMPSPHSQLALAERREQVRAIVASMQNSDQTMLTLRYVEDLSIREMAMELELNFETAKKRFYRAVVRFQQRCADHFGPDNQ